MERLNNSFRLHGIIIDPDTGVLRSKSGTRRIPPRLVNLLCRLAEADGATVERDALIQALWPRKIVNEEALSRAVAELRQALGDDARKPRFIETIPKRGYRLAAPVEPLGDRAEPRSRGLNRWLMAGLLLAALASTAVILYFKAPGGAPAINPALLASATRLTADPVMKFAPELSADGRWLAYIQFREGRGRLMVLSTAEPTAVREIASDHSLWSPAFNPAGSHLAVATIEGPDCDLLQISMTDGSSERLGSCRTPNVSPILDYSRDGTRLAYVDDDSATGSTAVWVMSLESGERWQVTAPPDAYSFDTRPRFSPDGETLSFSRGTRPAREIWMLEMSSGPDSGATLPQASQLTFDHQFNNSHDWLDDGSGLLLDSERSGHRALWRLDLEGNWSLLGARDAEAPSIAGNRLAFKVSQYESNIWRLDLATGELGDSALVASTKYDSTPAWSPDGREIAFASNRTGRGAIWIAASDGARQRMVYEPAEGRVVWPAWSPDGTFLVATQYGSGGQRIVKMALNQREVAVVPTGGERPYAGSYSADGRWFYYVAGAGSTGTRLWRQAADGETAATIFVDRPVNNYHLGDGEFVFYTKHGLKGLFRASLDDPADEQVILPEFPRAAWTDWTVADGWIYYAALNEAGDGELRRISLDGRDSQKLSNHYPSALGPNLAVHPSGTFLLLSSTDRTESDLFLVDLELD